MFSPSRLWLGTEEDLDVLLQGLRDGRPSKLTIQDPDEVWQSVLRLLKNQPEPTVESESLTRAQIYAEIYSALVLTGELSSWSSELKAHVTKRRLRVDRPGKEWGPMFSIQVSSCFATRGDLDLLQRSLPTESPTGRLTPPTRAALLRLLGLVKGQDYHPGCAVG